MQAPQQPAPTQSTPQSKEPQNDLWSEVQATAKELWGDQANAELEKLCKSNGMNFNKLSDSDVSVLLDIITERLGMQV